MTDIKREAVAVFYDAVELEKAIDKLQRSGFSRCDISLLANESEIKKKLGHKYKIEDLEDDPNVPRSFYVATEDIGTAEGAVIGGLAYIGATIAIGITAASGGTVAAILSAVMLGGGGV